METDHFQFSSWCVDVKKLDTHPMELFLAISKYRRFSPSYLNAIREYEKWAYQKSLNLLFILQVLCDINVQIATLRDLLIHVGTSKDSPELREKIRRVRRQCVEACMSTHKELMPQIKR